MADGAGSPERGGIRRRELLAAGVGAALALDGATASARAFAPRRTVRGIDFATRTDRPGWGGGWRTVGVANLRCESGLGLLEAGSDVFPNDPRPVAFLSDCRARDARISAALELIGDAPGVVLRRTTPRSYYAAVLDTEAGALRLLVRDGVELRELASAPVASVEAPLTLALEATGIRPTALRADVTGPSGGTTTVTASDTTERLQRRGDPGVLATANTLFPSDSNPVLPALGNLHLLPWSVQEGQAVMNTALGQSVIGEIRRRSTAGFRSIAVELPSRPRRSKPSVVAANTGRPLPGGARLQVATDTAAHVSFEIADSPRFTHARVIQAGTTGRFHAAGKSVVHLDPGRRVYWRAHLRHHGSSTTGPARSFRPVAADHAGPYRVAVAACGSQFGPIFGRLTEFDPDVFVWQGDLNYPDTHGPLAQTVSGYAGIWRDFLANPVLAETLSRAAFAPQRDDHDYAVQDANSTTIPRYPWALAPWKALMNDRTFYRFPVGAAEVWVLDQRLFKSDPTAADGPDKTLLGARQRRWLLRTLRASRAQFKVICSPTTVFMPANARDGNWATGFEAERERLLAHVRERVSGTTLFLTGDTHLTGVYDAEGQFEARAAPVGIPKPNDITLVDPLAAENLRRRPGVVYAGDENHFTMLEVGGRGHRAKLSVTLMREDGAAVYTRSFA